MIEKENGPQDEWQELEQYLNDKGKEFLADIKAAKNKLESENQELKELNESKEAMMHMIVHDMKNPLTVVMGALSLALGPRYELSDELLDLLRGSNIQAIKLRAMIDDILTMSKMKAKEIVLETTAIDVVSLVQQSVMLMNATMGNKKVNLIFEPAVSEVMVNVDFQMIERVINNIINNAIKYAPVDSNIEVEVTQTEKEAQVHVCNYGEAIPEKYHKKIFEMFGRANPEDKRIEGTGLGLAYCKLAVEAHGGEILVESPIPPQDNGAHFCFTLPLYVEKS
jgi:two-component system, sensor histidine kinase and response regulator